MHSYLWSLLPLLGALRHDYYQKIVETALKRLINGQDIRFDTHQRGDGQRVNVWALHLDKILHDGKGSIKFPFDALHQPAPSKGMSPEVIKRVTNEVKQALKNKKLAKSLGETIIDTFERFSGSSVPVERAEELAKVFAGYFGLDEKFINSTTKYADDRLVSMSTLHFSQHLKTVHEIYLSSDYIKISKVESLPSN